ncbi:MAG: hypothetical protein J0I20_32945 [Chloroflexi bacterium]|nr:hypothetical protein [Chloroflexota bacterium]OJV87028.1 MAG: hypothetical protein BGO39_33220 [Chloroflexi bacterium 54-19]
MTPLSFTQWIKQQTWRDDATGDLARDIRFDRCWPRWARGKSFYFNHLRYEHEACRACLAAFENAYQEWQSKYEESYVHFKSGLDLDLDWRHTLLGSRAATALVALNPGSGARLE